MNAGIFNFVNPLNAVGNTIQPFDPALPTTKLCGVFGLQPTTKPTVIEFDPSLNSTVSPRAQCGILLSTPVAVVIDWGDGFVEYTTAIEPTHVYTTFKKYLVRIRGAADGISAINSVRPPKSRMTRWLEWGDWPTTWQSANFNGVFAGTANLTVVPTTLPNNATDLYGMFSYSTSEFNSPNVGGWDVSRCTRIAAMFQASTGNFNQSLAAWNTKSITDISNFASQAPAFNAPLSGWDLSNVTVADSAFYQATAFNQFINNWQLNTTTNWTGSRLFQGAIAFNQPLNNWNMSKCTNMSSMFFGASAFNSSLAGWNLSACITALSMFQNATAFNQPINDWTLNTTTSWLASGMFSVASAFNQPLNNWNMSKCTATDSMFYFCTSFNSSLAGWNLSACTTTASMFQSSGFNQPINDWTLNTTASWSAASMFQSATAFNQPLNNWNMSKCTSTGSMFQSAAAFNSSLAGWNLSACTTTAGMFQSATAFNQPINDWTLNTTSSWTAANMFYFNPAFNQPLNNWNMSKCTSTGSMFYSCSLFNSSLAGWNLSNVTSAQLMFYSAGKFNQPISSWTMPTTIGWTGLGMLQLASSYKQSLASFNIAKCTNLTSFLANVDITTASYDATLIAWNNNKLVGANGIANYATNLTPSFGTSKYTAGGSAATARAALVTYGWTITDGGSI